eukprot:10558-Heterococcus_DN1.PRE.1
MAMAAKSKPWSSVPPEMRGQRTAAAMSRSREPDVSSVAATTAGRGWTPSPDLTSSEAFLQLLHDCEQQLRNEIEQLESHSRADMSRLKQLRTRAATLEPYPLGNVQVTAVGTGYSVTADWKNHDEKTLIAYDGGYKYMPPSRELLWEVPASALEELRTVNWCHKLPVEFRLGGWGADNPYLLMLATSYELDTVKANAKQQLLQDRCAAVAKYEATDPCGHTGCKRCSEQCSDFGDATSKSIAATKATVSALVTLSQQLKNAVRYDTADVLDFRADLWAIVEDHGYSAKSLCHRDNTEHIIEVGKRLAKVLKQWPSDGEHLHALLLVQSYPDKVILDLPGGKRQLKTDGQWETVIEAAVREGREETAQQLEVDNDGVNLCTGTQLIILIRGREGSYRVSEFAHSNGNIITVAAAAVPPAASAAAVAPAI